MSYAETEENTVKFWKKHIFCRIIQTSKNEKDNNNRIVCDNSCMQYLKRTRNNEREQSICRGRTIEFQEPQQ